MNGLPVGRLCSRLLTFIVTATVVLPLAVSVGIPAASAASVSSRNQHMAIDCSKSWSLCAEVRDSDAVFGHYVGHDEPAVLFYSKQPHSGNAMNWTFALPPDPAGTTPQPGQSYNFQLFITFWFSMALCDTQSYPEQVSTCTPDSDSNIVDPSQSPKHPGGALMEMQFYPPGWVEKPSGTSCDARQWCAALNIDSVSMDPVNGTQLNASCINQIGGSDEYVNFAYITKDGKPQAPPNPVQATTATMTPDPTKDLFMNSGDVITTSFSDTAQGLQVQVLDTTTNQSGSMVASAANGFGQVKFAPSPSTECTNIPYDFHPMYDTSSEQTIVPWAAHTVNVSLAYEVGHFDYCNGSSAITAGASCPSANTEGSAGDTEPTDQDDNQCFPASASLTVQVAGCSDKNTGADGVTYQPLWPDGNALHPQSLLFTSPLSGPQFTDNYDRAAFESITPSNETGTCDSGTGKGCTIIPPDDENAPAAFYPFFTIGQPQGNPCLWTFGNDIPGTTQNDFNQDNQYGSLLGTVQIGPGGAPQTIFGDYRQILPTNPCQVTATSSLHSLKTSIHH